MDLGSLQSSTVHTAMHCRSFRDDDILKCLEQFCGLHVQRTCNIEINAAEEIALVWRNVHIQSC